MKIAISTDGELVAEHFGRCPKFTIVKISNGKILEKEVIDNPGHETGFLPSYFHEKGVECIIAGGAGPRAIDLFLEQGIKFIGVSSKPIEEVLNSFVEGKLEEESGKCNPGEGKGYGLPKKDGNEI